MKSVLAVERSVVSAALKAERELVAKEKAAARASLKASQSLMAASWRPPKVKERLREV